MFELEIAEAGFEAVFRPIGMDGATAIGSGSAADELGR